MQLHQLTRKTANKKSVQVGRGGKRGKTAGRGTKGQKARAGRRMRPELRDIIKKIPKKRGHGKNRAKSTYDKPKAVTVNLSVIELAFDSGAIVSPVTLIEKGILTSKRTSNSGVKILGTGILTKKITISGCDVSAGAREKIESVGGSVA